MNKRLLLLLTALLLSACLPSPGGAPAALTPTTPTRDTATPFPIPAATETPMPTPIPGYSIEQLKAMTAEQKLAIAPQVTDAPSEVVSSFLPQGASATAIAWGEKTLSFWDRVVVYNGQVDSPGGKQDIQLYYDLESGQWARKYESFEEAAQIPAGQVPDVMVLTDPIMGDDRLIRAKLQYDYDWISQPQVMIDGKKVFRDEKGYPKAVFDTVGKKWLTPEGADVVYTLEKWKEMLKGNYTGGDENIYQLEVLRESSQFLTDPQKITEIDVRNPILVLHPSGLMTVVEEPSKAAEYAGEGAIIMTEEDTTAPAYFSSYAIGVATNAYLNGDKNIRVTFGEITSVNNDQMHRLGQRFWIKNILTTTDERGRVVSPIMDMPKHFKINDDSYAVDWSDFQTFQEAGLGEPDPIYWLDQMINAGFSQIRIFAQ